MTRPMAEWPRLLPGYDWRPAFWATRRARRGLSTPYLMPDPPRGILIHSGDRAAGTAEWCWQDEARYWAHFAWWAARGCYVQTDWLDIWAPHGGYVNPYAIGIEMPGPAAQNPRPERQRVQTVALVREIVEALPSIRWISGHQWIDEHKTDPGPGVDASWWEGLGLDVRWSWQGKGLR
jgi:hypothetical protein